MKPDLTLVANGLRTVGGKLVADPRYPERTRAFLEKLRLAASNADRQADASREGKARLLRATARQARRDADSIERTMR